MLPASGDDIDGGGLVFVSYSRDDVAWAQRFRVLLKPLVRRKHLRLWDDSAIRVGDEWHPAIEEAIDRSRVALVLVSADFLASDYIMDRELPALLTRGVLLAPVLVGDCFWSVVPELAAVQWLHDPGRDGPLGLHAQNPAERDRRIHRACDRLLTVTPEPTLAGTATTAAPPPPPVVLLPAPSRRPPDPAGPPPLETPPSRGPRHALPEMPKPGPALPGSPVVADVPEGDVAGALSRVPALPPRYVVRDELDGLVDAVVGTATGGAVGLTGEPDGVGLHGIGGIGKSVLAAALATDDRVRRRFPDGVYWVTVGERPDVLALQLDLLSRLGARPEARTRADAARTLRAALAEKRVLLVVDDVWSADEARDFRVTGPRGGLLYTSRDQAAVAAAGATAHRVGVLSSTAARELAGEVLGVPAATLPPAADRAFAAVGHVPLAVALLAAAVRGRQTWEQVTAEPLHIERTDQIAGSGGPSWEEIAADLARDADVYGTHPYATTFRALHIAVAALPADQRAALLGLAVFPPDSAVPVPAIARYWAHTRGWSAEETAADLDRLVAAEVLQRSGDTFGFHDLAHEYLLLNAEALPALHAQLLDAYRALLGEPNQWWTLPVGEPYVWEHLAAHLAGAGYRGTLIATATDPAYQAKRITRDGPHAGEADLALAARLVPGDPVVAWWRAWLGRHAHLLVGRSGSDARPARIAGTMLAWLEADSSRPDVIRPARLKPLLPRPSLIVHGGLHAESSALVRVLAGHTGGVQAVAWSPDGTRLATAGDDGTTRLWDPTSGQLHLQLTGHTNWVRAVAWSPDGTRLATAGADAAARIWDSTTGETVNHLTGHARGVQALAWSPDGTRLATAGADGTVRIRNPATGETLIQLTGHTDWVPALAWSPDGTGLATVDHSGSVRVWDLATGTVAATLSLSGRTRVVVGMVGMASWSPNGSSLAVIDDDGHVKLWDLTTDTLHTHTTRASAIAWSPDGGQLATGGYDGTVSLWNPTTDTTNLLSSHAGRIGAVAWSFDGTYVASASRDSTVRIWNPTAGAMTDSTLPGAPVTAVAWSPDFIRLAAGARTIDLWDPGTDTRTTLTNIGRHVLALAWHPDGTRLATSTDSADVVYDAVSGRVAARPNTRRVPAATAAWSPDLARIATDGYGSTPLLWDCVSGARAVELNGHTRQIRAAAWSPDGTVLATASEDRTVRLHRLTVTWWRGKTTARLVASLIGHQDAVRAVAWSPDSSRLASTGADRTLRLWDPSSGQSTATKTTGHADAVHSVDWSPNGAHLATADYSGLVIIWDRQLREVASLQLKPSQCLAWSAPLIAVGQPGRPAILALRDPADLV